jgi:DNA polymerase-3 subunit gamma/tau
MSYLVLARKYRPSTFSEVVEQSHVTQTLQNAVQSSRVAHAILFSGPRGTGKTTIARILAKSMNCYEGPTITPCNKCRSCKDITAGSAVDVMEVDGASNNGVEHIRDLREKVQYRPAHSRFKIYIIDEVHMLSTAAFNALLKTLEEPPDHVLFMFATTEPHKIPITILSRCQRHDLRRVKLDAIIDHLKYLCEQENIAIKREILTMVAREAGGSMRDALSLLDQVMVCMGDQNESQGEHDVLDILGVLDRKTIFSLSSAIIDGNIPESLDILHDIYDRGHDLKKMIVDLIEHFRNLLIVKLGKKLDRLVNVPSHEIDQMKKQGEKLSPHYINQIFDGLFQEEIFVRYAPQPRLALEKTIIKISSIQPVLELDSLIEKIDQLQETIAKNQNVTLIQAPKLRIPESQPVSTKEKETFIAEDKSYSLSKSQPQKLEKKQLLNQEKPIKEEFSKALEYDNGDPLDTTWKKLITRIGKQMPALTSVLNKASLKNFKNNTITIEINGPSFALDLVKSKNDDLKLIFNDYFQQQVTIECIQSETVESALKKQKKRIEQEQHLKKNARNHPLVQEAVQLFNAKIIDVKLLNL